MGKIYCILFLSFSVAFGAWGNGNYVFGSAGPEFCIETPHPGIGSAGNKKNKIADMPVLSPSDLPGALISRSDVYVGGALWGLINGAADLYYEYGFDRMALQEIELEGENLRLELYRMECPVGAYGIFSVSVHGCAEGGPASTGYCINRFQYQLYSGNYYLSIINYSGSDKAREISLLAAELLSNRISGPLAGLPGMFNKQPVAGYTDNIRLIRGIIGVRNVIPGLAHLFETIDDFEIWHLGFEDDAGQQEIMLVKSRGSQPLPEAGAVAEGMSMAGYAARETGGQVVAVMSAGFARSNELLDSIFISP